MPYLYLCKRKFLKVYFSIKHEIDNQFSTNGVFLGQSQYTLTENGGKSNQILAFSTPSPQMLNSALLKLPRILIILPQALPNQAVNMGPSPPKFNVVPELPQELCRKQERKRKHLFQNHVVQYSSHLKCDQSKWGFALSVKYTLDFEDLISPKR